MSASNRAGDQIALRMPEGMRERIKASANYNRRSMNSEIVVILERALNSSPLALDRAAARRGNVDE